MNKVVAVANQKGGVGKTTTAINLSACLALKNRRTLLIDLDPQGMSTLGLGKPKEPFKGIYQAMMNGRDLMDCVMGTELENFYLCPCSPELSGIEAELYAAERREKRLGEAVEKARRYFNFIIIDCPPSLGFLTINAWPRLIRSSFPSRRNSSAWKASRISFRRWRPSGHTSIPGWPSKASS